MKTKPFPAAGILAAVIIAGASLSIFTPMCCATIHWNGSLLAAGRSWNNYANWRELRTPQQDEDIVFPMEAFRFDTDNNMTAGMRFGRIILETNGVTITGNALGLLNGIECRAVSTTGENRIEVPIALAGALIQDVNVSRTTRLILSRVVSGSGGISKTGLGTLVFNGNDGDNTYAGDTMVKGGTIEFAKIGFFALNNSASLIIGDLADGSLTDTVLYQSGNQLSSTVNVIVNRSGVLDLNGHIDDVGDITLNAGSIQTGSAGQLQLLANVVARSEVVLTPLPSQFFPCRILGRLNLGSAGRTFTVSGFQGVGSPDLDISADIQGSAAVIKEGSGQMLLSGVNTFTGTVTVNDGTLIVGSSGALGSSSAGITVNNSAALSLVNSVTIASEALTLNSDAPVGDLGPSAALSSSSGNNVWNGPIGLRRNATVKIGTGSSLTMGGQISGPANIVKEGSGTLRLTAANTFDGDVHINAGVLVADNSQALASSKGSGTFVNAGGILELTGGITIGAGETLTLHTDGGVDALRVTSGNNSWTGPVVLMEPAARIGVVGGAALSLQGPVSATDPAFGIRKTQSGTLSFDGSPANTYTGPTTVDAGTLTLNRASGSVILGDLIIGDDSQALPRRSVTVLELAHGQIGSDSRVIVKRTGLFDIQAISTANSEEIGSLWGSGEVDIGPARLRCGGSGVKHNSTFDGVINQGTGGLSKAGNSTMILTGNNNYTGETRIGGGTLVINGSLSTTVLPIAGTVLVNAGGTLVGHGRIGHVVGAGGIIAPGIPSPENPTDVLTCSSLTLDPATTVQIELNGTFILPLQFDQIVVAGTCNLNNAILQVLPDILPFTVKATDQFQIVRKTSSGPITGVFTPWPNNQPGPANGNVRFKARYDTDVTLLVDSLPASLVPDSQSQSPARFETGNGNQQLDPDECNDVRIPLLNQFHTPLTEVSARLDVAWNGVIITQPSSPYPDLDPGASGQNIIPFQISTLPSIPFGTVIPFKLIVNSHQGAFTLEFNLTVGKLLQQISFTDNVGTTFAGATSLASIDVSGVSGVIGKLAVGVFFDRPVNGDLFLDLVHPDGTSVLIFGSIGGGNALGTAAEDAVFLDDFTLNPFPGAIVGTAGSFRSDQHLSEFAGRLINGRWQLRVRGTHSGVASARLRRWSLRVTPAESYGSGMCALCPADFTISGQLAYFGSFLAGPNYSGFFEPSGECIHPTPLSCDQETQGGYDSYLFLNTGPDRTCFPNDGCISSTCIEVRVQSTCTAVAGVVVNPASDRLDYCPATITGTRSGFNDDTTYFTVTSDQYFLVFVQGIEGFGAGCGDGVPRSYTLTVRSLNQQQCQPPRLLEMRRAGNQNRVTYSTAAAGYRVQCAPKITGPWSNILAAPIIEHSNYVLTNSATAAMQFYRLYKP